MYFNFLSVANVSNEMFLCGMNILYMYVHAIVGIFQPFISVNCKSSSIMHMIFLRIKYWAIQSYIGGHLAYISMQTCMLFLCLSCMEKLHAAKVVEDQHALAYEWHKIIGF